MLGVGEARFVFVVRCWPVKRSKTKRLMNSPAGPSEAGIPTQHVLLSARFFCEQCAGAECGEVRRGTPGRLRTGRPGKLGRSMLRAYKGLRDRLREG